MIAPTHNLTLEGAVTLSQLKRAVLPGFQKREPVDPEEWLPQHVRFPAGSEEAAFDWDEAPYCRGVVTRFWNDPRRRKANLCWAVRLGKTSIVLGLMLWTAENEPTPMSILFPDNDILASGMDDHVDPMMDATPVIRKQLPPPHERNKRVIRFDACRVRLASAGKKSSVSGFPARKIFKIEHEKCGTRSSSEADPSARIDSRAAGYPIGVKILEEGSPAEKSVSRVHVMISDPDVMQLWFYVQCPHCKTHQPLEFENVKWDEDPVSGRKTASSARQTARYVCTSCGEAIENHHRRDLIQSGKWVAEGEKIDRRGRITGTPVADASDEMVFGPLSSLYSLRIAGWGTVAAEYMRAKAAERQGKLEPLRKFYTETLARVWDPLQRRTHSHHVAERLVAADHETVSTLPEWTSFLTLTADVGKIGETLVFYWMVTAWGAPEKIPRGAVVDWGVTEGKAEFVKEWRAAKYPLLPDGKLLALWGQPSAIDSGDFTQEIYDLTAPIKNCFPLKGDSRRNKRDLYQLGYTQAGLSARQIANKKKQGRADLFEPSSDVTQGWRQALVEGRMTLADPGFVSLPADVCERWEEFKDFLDELTADQLIDGRWKGSDNEFGDTLRYSRALAECYVHGRYRGRWENLPLIEAANRHGTAGLYSRRSASTKKSKRFIKGY